MQQVLENTNAAQDYDQADGPAIAAAGLLNFTRALESFDIPLIMGLGAGYQMFSTAIYYALRILSPYPGLALAYSVVLVAFATFGLLIYQ